MVFRRCKFFLQGNKATNKPNHTECMWIVRDSSIPIFSDSQGAIQLAKNGNYSPKTKHIIIPKYTFVKDYILDKAIDLNHISGEQMIADMLTEAAEAIIVQRCAKGMGLINVKNLRT